jgi:hypothetical protein
MRLYFSEVSIDHLQEDEANRFLDSMPTSLELENIQVDHRAQAMPGHEHHAKEPPDSHAKKCATPDSTNPESNSEGDRAH